ncbi:MAG: hypothetical protein K8R87_04815 [Verrucomicrobia bacterium]|nr:hypothetical protein [Verrucomicrobiota bacterium]
MRILSLFVLLLATCVRADEVQHHGVVFEQWVRDTFFGGYKPKSYTQIWDIPAEINQDHGKIPANPKAIKYGSPIDMGDALRQFRIAEKDERFLLIIGFWTQDGENKKWANAVAVEVTPEQYRKLWEPITRDDLEKLDAIVKNKSLSLADAREEAKRIKGRAPFTKSIMQVNPKIDASQRRLQCSIRFGDFFHFLAPQSDSTKQDKPAIWGVPLPDAFASAPRKLKK